MKNQSKRLLMFAFVLFAGMGISTKMNSQTNPTATVSAGGIVQLPTNVAVSNTYVFDLAPFNFATANAAVQYFSTKTFLGFSIRPNTGQNKGVLMLDTKDHPTWTAAQWNTHLNSQFSAQPLSH